MDERLRAMHTHRGEHVLHCPALPSKQGVRDPAELILACYSWRLKARHSHETSSSRCLGVESPLVIGMLLCVRGTCERTHEELLGCIVPMRQSARQNDHRLSVLSLSPNCRHVAPVIKGERPNMMRTRGLALLDQASSI